MISGGFRAGNNPASAAQYLVRTGTDYGSQMQSEVSARIRQLTQQLQTKLNADIAGGPVAFTKRALFFNFIRNSDGSRTNQIIVRGDQAAYLRTVMENTNTPIDKFIPTSSARLNKQGNISGLKAGLGSKKFIVVEEKGKKCLIDTSKKSKKQHSKRVVAVRENKKRKVIFDFFQNAEDGARLALNDVNGSYRFTKRIN